MVVLCIKNKANGTTTESYPGACGLVWSVGISNGFQFKQFECYQQSICIVPYFEYFRLFFSHHLCFFQESTCQLGFKFYLATYNCVGIGERIFGSLNSKSTGMENISIRKITTGDIDQLQTIGRQTFWETFSLDNTKEDMQKYLEDSFSKEKLVVELKNEDSAFYFAEADKNVLGYLKLNFGQSQTELKDSNAVEIERIYVLKDFHGKKVGQLLYETAMQVANERQAEYVWLGVWEENARAISFYKKNGFVEFSKHIFKLGNDEQTDILMKLKLGR